jgi:hypothetical protein
MKLSPSPTSFTQLMIRSLRICATILGLLPAVSAAQSNTYWVNWTDTPNQGTAGGILVHDGIPVNVSVSGCTMGTVTNETFNGFIQTIGASGFFVQDALGSDHIGPGYVIEFSQPVSDLKFLIWGKPSALTIKADGVEVELVGDAWDPATNQYNAASGTIIGNNGWTSGDIGVVQSPAMYQEITIPGTHPRHPGSRRGRSPKQILYQPRHRQHRQRTCHPHRNPAPC